MDANRISTALEPVLAAHDLEVEAVEIQRAGRRSVVRVVVDGDGPQGNGPGLDDIAAATQSVSAALDESDVTGDHPYTLEVSSRGVTRPLALPRQWRRNTGRLVKVSFTSDEEPVIGRIVETDDDLAVLDIAGEHRSIPYTEVAKAQVQVEFNRKEG